MTATQIDSAYNDLVSSIDRESRRLKQALAEQEMKDEGERLKKIQVKTKLTYIYIQFFNKYIKISNIQKELEREKAKKLDEDKRFEQESDEFRQ